MTVRRNILFLGILCLLSPFAAGADGFLVSESAYRTLSQAEEHITRQAHREAVALLDRASARSGLNGYEHALFERLAGVALIGVGDYAAAVARFEVVLAGAALPAAVLEQTKYRLAQLYLHQARYDDALALLKPWRDEVEPSSAEAYFLIASVYAGLERPVAALEWGERGLARADTPAENQYVFVANLNLVLEHYLRAAELFEQLIERHPRTAQYWRQLSVVYSELERGAQALAVAELGYLQGVLTADKDMERLVRLYLHRKLPYKAAVLLEDALQTDASGFDAARYRLLADAWIAARDYRRAVRPLGKAVGLLHAVGDFEEEAETHLRKGMIHAHLAQYGEAEREFEYCLKFERTRDAAGRWLAYVRTDE